MFPISPIFQMAEVAVPKETSCRILRQIRGLRRQPAPMPV